MIDTSEYKELTEKHRKFCERYLKQNILMCINQIHKQEDIDSLKKFMDENFIDLVCGFPVNVNLNCQLNEIVTSIKGRFKVPTEKGNGYQSEKYSFSTCMQKVFLNNYTLFSKIDNNVGLNSDKSKWSAYEYTSLLEIIVCPYCNSEFIFTQFEEKNTGDENRITIRPQLDHFYSKKDYPYLASSIYNLVPSCKTCNTSIKGSAEIGNQPHMNPLEHNPYDYVKFSRKLNSSNNANSDEDYYSILTGYNNNVKLELKKLNNNIKEKDFIRAFNTLEFFRIKERYEPYKYYIQKQITRELLYNKLYRENLEDSYPKIFSVGEIKTLVNESKEVGGGDKYIFSKVISDLLN